MGKQDQADSKQSINNSYVLGLFWILSEIVYLNSIYTKKLKQDYYDNILWKMGRKIRVRRGINIWLWVHTHTYAQTVYKKKERWVRSRTRLKERMPILERKMRDKFPK